MMDSKLIIDAGSTKSDWSLFSNQSLANFSFQGINPSTQSADSLSETIKIARQSINHNPSKIYFYGSGCGSPQAKEKLKPLLTNFFPGSSIFIETDLVAAARACCFGEEGIICILGTGSHAAMSDGHQIIHQLPSLGYIFGDEGGSNHMAKLFIREYFMKDMDGALKQKAQTQIDELKQEFIYKFYNSQYPTLLLSKVGRFVLDNKTHPAIIQIINTSLNAFIDIRLKPYTTMQHLAVHSVGSYAHFLQDEFKHCLTSHGFIAGLCLQKPISRLIEYHQSYDIN